MTDNYYVIVPVAGSGSRFGSSTPKQYTFINRWTILHHTLNALLKVPRIKQIILVANQYDDKIDDYALINDKIAVHKVGGATRAESVINGLKTISCQDNDWVMVHDAARCCITPMMINKLIDNLSLNPVGGILASQATDTIKHVVDGLITHTIPRQNVYLAQTPQMFRYNILFDALSQADLALITDEASAIEQAGLTVQVVENDNTNIKITYPQDIEIAKILLEKNSV